jgi:hypothetical protein
MSAKKSRLRKSIIAAIAIGGAISATGFAVQQTAMAGTNGQQITFCSSYEAKSTEVSGLNQDGDPVTIAFDISYGRPAANGCYPSPENWWKGLIKIKWNFEGGKYSTTYCYVPLIVPSDDPWYFVKCNDAPPEAGK